MDVWAEDLGPQEMDRMLAVRPSQASRHAINASRRQPDTQAKASRHMGESSRSGRTFDVRPSHALRHPSNSTRSRRYDTQPEIKGNVTRNVTDWLDVLPKWLRFCSSRKVPTSEVRRRPRKPLILLGLISGQARRRELLRCTWMKEMDTTAITLRFVVGRGAPEPPAEDILRVPVDEHRLMKSTSTNGSRRAASAPLSSTYSTYSSYVKLIYFLRYAAGRPEPAVGVGDDDVFLQPQMLVAYMHLLLGTGLRASPSSSDDEEAQTALNAARVPPHVNRWQPSNLESLGHGEWYAGLFEWYSWRTWDLQATGFHRSMLGALYGAVPRNCSPTGAGWIPGTRTEVPMDEKHPKRPANEQCVGPFAFAKGPLILLGAPVVRWVVASEGFARDVALANQIAEGVVKTAWHVERIPQDVQLGFWLRTHPTLTYVNLGKRFVWADYWVDVWDLDRLLLGHRIPFDQLAWLSSRSARRWKYLSHLNVQLYCAGSLCTPSDCAHAAAQRVCSVDMAAVSINSTHTPAGEPLQMGCSSCSCWEGTGLERRSSGGECNFSRLTVPDLPRMCWQG